MKCQTITFTYNDYLQQCTEIQKMMARNVEMKVIRVALLSSEEPSQPKRNVEANVPIHPTV